MSRFSFPPLSRCVTRITIAAAGLAGILIASGTAHAQALYQSPAPILATGTLPQGVAASDFARSGFQSLVVTDSISNNMEVYLATGPGIFAAASTYTTCTGPTEVLPQDFNRDGYADIVVACPVSNSVELFLNDGTGHFGPPVPFTVTDPVGMAAGDFTNGGFTDLVVANGTGGVTILMQTISGVVTKTFSVPGIPTGIATGDFNHDGYVDLAVSDSANNDVRVLNGDGTGNFTLSGSYPTGSGTKPTGIVAADFNNDGNLDVATINSGTNSATILLGSATGALTAQAAQAAGTNPIGISVTDVNSDGKPDLVILESPTSSTGALAVLLGNGDGTLQTAQIMGQTFVPGTFAAVADFNQDGKPDLAVTGQNTNNVSLLLNNTLQTQYPDGRSFAAAHALTNGYGNMADSVATGDFNKDGLLDIAVSYLEDAAVRVLTNNGNGFNTAAIYPVGQQPYWVASGDLNGDGYADLVTANTTTTGATGTVSVLLNNGKSGNGTFASAVNYPVGKQPYQVAIGDLNGDGYPDLAVTNYGGNSVTILMGSQTGTFTPSTTTLSTCANPYGVAIGDFKHNGFPSIAVTCYSSSQLEVFPNSGNGTFGTPSILTTGTHPASLVVGNFNRDDKLDIVVGNTTTNDISFFAGNGDNTFAAGVISPSLNFPVSIAAGDVNGDGILDIVGVSPNFNNVVVTLGVGDGTFGTFDQRSAGEFSATKQPWAVALGDFNNDGQLDIVTANTYNQVSIASPTYQERYMTEYPATGTGNPSIDVLANASAAHVNVSVAPPNNTSPIPSNNTDVVLQASIQPTYSGPSPTGSVIFELQTPGGTVLATGPLSNGAASYNAGHLDSGSYQFTSLYSGDANFQPATAVPAMITVAPSVPTSGTTCNGTYTGTFQGNLTTSPGQICIFVSGGVTGNVTENGGSLTLSQSQVGGNVQINSGTFTIGPGSSIGGNLAIKGLTSGSGQNQVCGTLVYGNLTFENSGTAVVIGNPTSCAGNVVGGNLTVSNNSAATIVNGNTVGGNETDSSNTAPTQVFSNMISHNLMCLNDSSITGGGNTAGNKGGQCATF